MAKYVSATFFRILLSPSFCSILFPWSNVLFTCVIENQLIPQKLLFAKLILNNDASLFDHVCF